VATYISLVSFTDQGIRNVKDSPARFEAFRAMAEKAGASVKGVWYTVGTCDMVTIVEGPDDAVTPLLLKVGSLGNVRSQTMRAFSVDEMRSMLAQMACGRRVRGSPTSRRRGTDVPRRRRACREASAGVRHGSVRHGLLPQPHRVRIAVLAQLHDRSRLR